MAPAGELVENGRADDVAGMEDVVAAAQEIERLRSQQPVRVGNQADAHGPGRAQRRLLPTILAVV